MALRGARKRCQRRCGAESAGALRCDFREVAVPLPRCRTSRNPASPWPLRARPAAIARDPARATPSQGPPIQASPLRIKGTRSSPANSSTIQRPSAEPAVLCKPRPGDASFFVESTAVNDRQIRRGDFRPADCYGVSVAGAKGSQVVLGADAAECRMTHGRIRIEPAWNYAGHASPSTVAQGSADPLGAGCATGQLECHRHGILAVRRDLCS